MLIGYGLSLPNILEMEALKAKSLLEALFEQEKGRTLTLYNTITIANHGTEKGRKDLVGGLTDDHRD